MKKEGSYSNGNGMGWGGVEAAALARRAGVQSYLGCIILHNPIHIRQIQAAGRHIRTKHKGRGGFIAELLEVGIALLLGHPAVEAVNGNFIVAALSALCLLLLAFGAFGCFVAALIHNGRQDLRQGQKVEEKEEEEEVGVVVVVKG